MSFSDYGTDEVETRVSHFQPVLERQGVDTSKINTEFILLHLMSRTMSIIIFSDYGTDEVETRVSHFQPVLKRQGVDTSKINTEFILLQTALYLGAGWKRKLEGASWSQLNRQYGDAYLDLNVLAVIQLVLTLPSLTADYERGFSAMKATKTDWRASLRSDT